MQGISMEGMDIDAGLTMEDLLVQYFANQAREECCCRGAENSAAKRKNGRIINVRRLDQAGGAAIWGNFSKKFPFSSRKLSQNFVSFRPNI